MFILKISVTLYFQLWWKKGIQTKHSPPHIVCAVSWKLVGVSSSKSRKTTIHWCGNAIGTMLSPFHALRGQRSMSDLLDGSLVGAVRTVSNSEGMNGKIFQKYLKIHVLKYLQRRNPSQTVLLLFGGHRSYVSILTTEWAKTSNIKFFVLPAHTSHIL